MAPCLSLSDVWQNPGAMPHAVEFPIPGDWQVFEDFCCELFAEERGDR